MTQVAQTEKEKADERKPWSWRKILGRESESSTATANATLAAPLLEEDTVRPGLARRISRKVVPGLPRPGTFKRQQSELRGRLEPTKPKPEERRAVSVDRRRAASTVTSGSPRLSAPELLETEKEKQTIDAVLAPVLPTITTTTNTHEDESKDFVEISDVPSNTWDVSVASSEGYADLISLELERRWILNLSMHFRDKSQREKFFVTFAETPTHWRRVTISLDYRNATKGSLEAELQGTRFQRDKSARIYEAIRESLPDIQFYDTVTNLKLQTENERLHVHVVEDLSEIISYPPVRAISHLKCRRIREDELVFDSHLSGFVYKVRVDGEVFIKKEIPGPDTVDEFLYEINALHQLSGSHSVIQFGGVVLDNKGEIVKGLLISFAEQGALIDVIYDGDGKIPWRLRERWAKQIVQGLSEIHEAGFVQGDFTLSNIVIDEDDNAKIIDINRRGCPVGWEPPEVAALIESNQRISMYIGVKSDLFQLGMVLYALAIQQDEPENQRPLNLNCFPEEIPDYYLDLCHRCLNDDPRYRSQAIVCLSLFPEIEETFHSHEHPIPIVVDARHIDEDTFNQRMGFQDHRKLSSVYSPGSAPPGYAETDITDESEYFPRRGRSPPRREWQREAPLPDGEEDSEYLNETRDTTWEFEDATLLAALKDRQLIDGGKELKEHANEVAPLVNGVREPDGEGLHPLRCSPPGTRNGGTAFASIDEVPCSKDETELTHISKEDRGAVVPAQDHEKPANTSVDCHGHLSKHLQGELPILQNHTDTDKFSAPEDDGAIRPPSDDGSTQKMASELLTSTEDPQGLIHTTVSADGTQHITEATQKIPLPSNWDTEPKLEEIPVPATFHPDLIGIGEKHGACDEKLPQDLVFEEDVMIPRQTCS